VNFNFDLVMPLIADFLIAFVGLEHTVRIEHKLFPMDANPTSAKPTDSQSVKKASSRLLASASVYSSVARDEEGNEAWKMRGRKKVATILEMFKLDYVSLTMTFFSTLLTTYSRPRQRQHQHSEFLTQNPVASHAKGTYPTRQEYCRLSPLSVIYVESQSHMSTTASHAD